MKSEFDTFDPQKFVREKIREEKENKERLEFDEEFKLLFPKPKEIKSNPKEEKIIKIDKRVLKALAGLVKKKVIDRRILKKGKRAVLVIKSPRILQKAKSIFFNREAITFRRGV